jgi:hypothetical protein
LDADVHTLADDSCGHVDTDRAANVDTDPNCHGNACGL